MANLDYIPRVGTSTFKLLFKASRKVTETIENHPERAEELLPKLRAVRGSFSYEGTKYTYKPVVIETGELEAIEFTWKYYGETCRAKAYIGYRRSNLGKGYTLFFYCPVTHRPCTKLFLWERYIVSRYAFTHTTYNSRLQSSHMRKFGAREEPYRDYGKRTYRGKLTPYGKRVSKYEQREEERWGAIGGSLLNI